MCAVCANGPRGRAGDGGELVETVVDCVALGEAGEEAPGDDLAGGGAGRVDAAVVGVEGGEVPLEGSGAVLAWHAGCGDVDVQ